MALLRENKPAVITVHARLYATLRRPGVGLGEVIRVGLPAGATVGQLIQQMDLPADQVKLVFVNGLARDQRCVLADGDEVGIFPPVGGG